MAVMLDVTVYVDGFPFSPPSLVPVSSCKIIQLHWQYPSGIHWHVSCHVSSWQTVYFPLFKSTWMIFLSPWHTSRNFNKFKESRYEIHYTHSRSFPSLLVRHVRHQAFVYCSDSASKASRHIDWEKLAGNRGGPDSKRRTRTRFF